MWETNLTFPPANHTWFSRDPRVGASNCLVGRRQGVYKSQVYFEIKMLVKLFHGKLEGLKNVDACTTFPFLMVRIDRKSVV
jgi:hypothetical protein